MFGNGIISKADMPEVLCLRKSFLGADGERIEKSIPIVSILQNLDDEARLKDKDLSPRDVRTALTLAAMKLPDSEQYKRNNRYKRTKILLDENLSSRLIPELSTELSNLSHIYFEGMQGYMDDFIYWRPWSQLRNRSAKQQRAHNNTKYLIITQDSDLTDIARAQWLNRMACSSTPEDIDFSNANAIFHVRDITLGKPENAVHYLPLAKDILRAAYSGEASSYVITRSGVRPEEGCSKQELISYLDERQRYERIHNNQATEEDVAILADLRRQKEMRWARPAPVAA